MDERKLAVGLVAAAALGGAAYYLLKKRPSAPAAPGLAPAQAETQPETTESYQYSPVVTQEQLQQAQQSQENCMLECLKQASPATCAHICYGSGDECYNACIDNGGDQESCRNICYPDQASTTPQEQQQQDCITGCVAAGNPEWKCMQLCQVGAQPQPAPPPPSPPPEQPQQMQQSSTQPPPPQSTQTSQPTWIKYVDAGIDNIEIKSVEQPGGYRLIVDVYAHINENCAAAPSGIPGGAGNIYVEIRNPMGEIIKQGQIASVGVWCGQNRLHGHVELNYGCDYPATVPATITVKLILLTDKHYVLAEKTVKVRTPCG